MNNSKCKEDLQGTCPICKKDGIKIIKSTGLLYRHRTRDKPCPGHNLLPQEGSTMVARVVPCSSQKAGRVQKFCPASFKEDTFASHADGPNVDWSGEMAVPTTTRNPFSIRPPHEVRVLKRIPKGARLATAKTLLDLIDKVTNDINNMVAWDRLMGVSTACLARPDRGGRSHNLTSRIRKQVSAYHEGATITTLTPVSKLLTEPKASTHEALALAKRASSKLEDGDIRGAMRILTTNDSIAVNNHETYTKLKDIHPTSHPGRRIQTAPSTEAYKTTPAAVKRAIISFPNGSAGGPDNIRPQHLKDLLVGTDFNDPLLLAITNLTNVLLAGGLPRELRPTICGGTLIAIRKKQGGIRPIAIGNVWRRIAGKVAGQHVSLKCAELLAPLAYS